MKLLLRYGFHLLATGLFLTGCFKTDNAPQLEVVVLTLDNQPVEGAYVGLFVDFEDWLGRENPVQVWKQTGSDGRILFTDLEEQNYFIYARSNLMDNSSHEISTFAHLEINKKAVIRVHIE
jgi:hypothetical protein